MSGRLNIVEFEEILVPDLPCLGVWAPVFFALMRGGEALGSETTMDIKGAFELSLLVAYLISIAVVLCRFHPTPALSEGASPQLSRARNLQRPVRDAVE